MCGFAIKINQKTARRLYMNQPSWAFSHRGKKYSWQECLHNCHRTVKRFPAEVLLSGSHDGSKVVLTKEAGKLVWYLWTYMGGESLDYVFQRFSLPEKFRQNAY